MSTISPIVIANVSSVEKTRSALTGLLVENGYLVREGKNGVEALSLAEENPHLIVLDINLDDINGYEVCRRIKSNPSTYFNMVLFVSDGCRESSCRVKGLEVGAVGCLQADSDTSELLATIKSLVRIRKMDEKVRQSSLQWRATFDAINEGVSLLDEYGNVVRCNRAMADLLGLTFIDIIGKPYEHLILNSLGEITLPSFEQLKHTKNREISEFSLNAGWYSASADPVVDDEDNLSGAVYIVTDLTDRKNIELDLINERAKAESSEQQYRLLTQALPQLVWTATRHGQLDYFNQRWFDYTGLSQQESVSGGWQNVVHEDDLQTCLIRWHKALESGDVFEYECRLKRKDGTYRWYLNRAVPLYDNEQRIVKWIGTSTDIEEQKRLQDALRFVAEVSEILSASLDYHATLAGVARLSVPKMADWCLVDVLEEAGSIRRIAIEHSDPESVSRAWKRKGVYSPDPSSSSKLGKVLRTGIPEIIPEITEEILNQVTSEPEYLNELRELHLKSCMVVPLVARGRILGAITFITADSGRYYTSARMNFSPLFLTSYVLRLRLCLAGPRCCLLAC
jgi:PAS domain S-box-containing protein